MMAVLTLLSSFISLSLFARFVLRLFGANPEQWLVGTVYGLTDPLLMPFAGIFNDTTIERGVVQGVFEWTSIIALCGYALISAGLFWLLNHLNRRVH